jgi:hypothetical protein
MILLSLEVIKRAFEYVGAVKDVSRLAESGEGAAYNVLVALGQFFQSWRKIQGALEEMVSVQKGCSGIIEVCGVSDGDSSLTKKCRSHPKSKYLECPKWN